MLYTKCTLPYQSQLSSAHWLSKYCDKEHRSALRRYIWLDRLLADYKTKGTTLITLLTCLETLTEKED